MPVPIKHDFCRGWRGKNSKLLERRSWPPSNVPIIFEEILSWLHLVGEICHDPNPIQKFVTLTDMLISSFNMILTITN